MSPLGKGRGKRPREDPGGRRQAALRPVGRFSPAFHRAVAALVRARCCGDEGVEDVASGAAASGRIREAVEARAGLSPFKWVEPEDPRAPFRWLDALAGPVCVCFLLLHESSRAPCQRLHTAENLAACAEEVLRRQMREQQGARAGCTGLPYRPASLRRETEDALLGCFQAAEDRTRSRVLLAVQPLWEEALALLPKFRLDDAVYVTTSYRGLHDALLARFLRRRSFFRLPELDVQGTPEQRACMCATLAHLREHGWATLTGCGGAGKTYLLAQVARALAGTSTTNDLRGLVECPLCEQPLLGASCPCGLRLPREAQRAVSVAFAAPTNRAVSVLQKMLQPLSPLASPGDEPRRPHVSTLHSLAFARHALPFDLLVLDESSMLDAEHGDLLVGCSALRGAAVLFVGDDLQLPPVGRGELLRPLLGKAKLPALQANLRAEGAALAACVLAVRRGRVDAVEAYVAPPSSDPERLEQVFFQAAVSMRARVLALRNEERIAYCAHAILASRPVEDARDEFARGLGGARTFVPFRGEPVRFQTNDHRPEACKGMLGEVVTSEETPRGAWLLQVRVGEHVVRVEASSLQALASLLRPAFAITVHDAQGGEFEEVHVLLPPKPNSPLCTLEMLYTAVSRASRQLTLWPHSTAFAEYAPYLRTLSTARATPLSAILQKP